MKGVSRGLRPVAEQQPRANAATGFERFLRANPSYRRPLAHGNLVMLEARRQRTPPSAETTRDVTSCAWHHQEDVLSAAQTAEAAMVACSSIESVLFRTAISAVILSGANRKLRHACLTCRTSAPGNLKETRD